MNDMPARGKDAVAVFSLAMLALLACGLVGRIGVDIQYITGSGAQALHHRRELSVEDGRVRCFSITSAFIPRGFGTSIRFHPFSEFWPLRTPDVSKLLFGFDDHPLPGTSPATAMYILSCPTWFAALPFLISPVLWVRKRRRAEAPRFAVIVGNEKSD